MSQKTYDAFLSHNSKDKPVVEEIGKYLEETAGITVFLDKWDLIPGGKWQEELEKALSESRSCVFFVGQGGIGAWQNEEMRIALDEMVTSGTIRIVPVLLPGGKQPKKESRLPGFLRQHTWVEFKNQWDEPDALNRLVCGIKGIRPRIEKAAHVGAAAQEIQCPFRGLEVFREEEKEFFFGREAIVQRLMTRLRDARFLAVIGPSGVGKSSIVQAGLIPRLRNDSLVALFTPRMNPIEELAFALLMGCRHDDAVVKTPVEEWVKRMNASPDALHFIAREALEPLKSTGKKRWLLVVDQLEELFTQTRSEEERRKFIALLLKAVEKQEGPVAVIVTMRSDFLGKCAYYPDLNVYVTDYLEQIGTMGRDELRSALEEPAHTVGLEFEEGLVNRILEDAGGGAGELPLVEHALLELFTDKKDGYLTMAAYTRIGGIAGALPQRAEEEFGKLADTEKEILRNMFVLRLVQPGEGTEDTRRRAVKEELLAVGGDKDAAGVILKKWTDARLLTVMHDPGRNQDMVDAAHESLIRKWDRIKQWMAEGREVSRQTGILRQATREWEQADKNPDFLYQGARLAQLETLLDSHAEDLTETEKEFIRAGVERREWEQRQEKERTEELLKTRARVIRRSRVILAVVLIALVGMAVLWYLSNENKKDAQRQLAMNYRDNGHLARQDGDSLKALHWLVEATLLTPDPVARNNYLLDMNRLWDRNELLHIFKREDNISRTVFNRDGTKILTFGGNTARLWEAGTGKPIGIPMTHNNKVNGAVFNRDETKILIWSEDNTARLWEAETGKPIGPSMTHDSFVTGAMFNRDETKILTWSEDNTARLWEADTGKPIGPPMKYGNDVDGSMFNWDANLILTKSVYSAWLWEAKTGKPIGPPMKHDGRIKGAVFNRDGTKILTWSWDKTVRLWEAGIGKPIGLPMKHDNNIYGAKFNWDETRILTWGDDNIARLWESGTGKPIGQPMIHDGAVHVAIFNRDGTRIFTWSDYQTAWLWNAKTGELITKVGNVWDAVFNNDVTTILTWSYKAARLWDVGTGEPISEPIQHDRNVNGALVNSDGTKILTWNDDNTTWLWNTRVNKPIDSPKIYDRNVYDMMLNENETKILTLGDKTARLWEAKTGKPIGPPMKHDGWIKGAVFNRDGTKILTLGDKTARLWEAKTGKPIGPPMKHDDWIMGAVFNRYETKILTWSDDKNVRLWEAGTGKSIGPPMKHDGRIKGAVFNRDETRILTWSSDCTIRLWEAGTGKLIDPAMKHNDKVWGAAFNRDETRILTWSEDHTARLWEAGTGKPIGTPMTHNSEVSGAKFNRDETKILTWSQDGTAQLWEAGTGKPIGPPMKHGIPIFDAMFNRDETRILTSSLDGIIYSFNRSARLWEAGTGKQIGQAMKQDGSNFDAVFNRNGTKILTWSAAIYGETGSARLWDAGTGKPIGPPMTHGGAVNGAAFNRDETRILTWSNDNTVRLWEAGTGKPIGEPMRHDESIRWAKFNRDETEILTLSEDYYIKESAVRLWNIDVDYDFPPSLLRLQIAALTGTEFNSITGEITFMEPERFEKLKAEYLEKAAQHYKSCKFKNANIFHHFYPEMTKDKTK